MDANTVWATSADEDATWGSSGDDQVVFPAEDISEPLPNLDLEFGEQVPVQPAEVPVAPASSVIPTVVGSTLQTVTPVSIGGF
jgi:hypothetical protein